jgi:hypothetical protein
MSAFKEMMGRDVKNVFLNPDEMAEIRTVVYDGETYADIPIILDSLEQKDRPQYVTGSDHAQGLFLVTAVLFCALSDLGGNVPKKGMQIKISDGPAFFRSFYVASSSCDMDMIRAELEAIDE